MLYDTEVFPLQVNRGLPQGLSSPSVLVAKVLTRIKSLYNPTGPHKGRKKTKDLKKFISMHQKEPGEYIRDPEGQNVKLDWKKLLI